MAWAKLAAVVGLIAAIVLGVKKVAGSTSSPLAYLLFGLAGMAVVVLVLFFTKLRELVDDYGPLVFVTMMVHWHLGLPHHGDPMTNATWHYRGTRALTETGHARHAYYLPRKHLALSRTVRSAVLLGGVYGLVAYREVTEWLLLGAGLAGVWYSGQRFWAWIDDMQHHRDWTTPVHLAAAPIADVPYGHKPRGWVEVAKDRNQVTLHLPVDYNPEEKKDQKLVDAVAAKVGIEDPLVKWKLAGSEPTVTVGSAPHAPNAVSLEELLAEIKMSSWDRFVLGAGRPHAGQRTWVSTSLGEDSPHIAMSMGSGAGKTTLTKLLVAQWCYKGGVVYILNPKRRGYQWAKGLKNVVVAETNEQIFGTLDFLGKQLDERNETASEHSDWDDKVEAGYLDAPVLVVVEEMNILVSKQVKYWKHEGEQAAFAIGWPDDAVLPKHSPALDSLEELAFAGRQAEMFCCFIGQRLSAKVISGDVLENVGVRLLGRYSMRNWNMMAPEWPMVPSQSHPGRIQVISSEGVRECQVAYSSDARDYRDLALAGTAQIPSSFPESLRAPLPAFLAGQDRDVVPATQLERIKLAQQSQRGSATGEITLPEAGRTRLVGRSYDALRQDKARFSQFPQHSREEGGVYYYWEQDLVDYYQGVRRTDVRRVRADSGTDAPAVQDS